EKQRAPLRDRARLEAGGEVPRLLGMDARIAEHRIVVRRLRRLVVEADRRLDERVARDAVARLHARLHVGAALAREPVDAHAGDDREAGGRRPLDGAVDRRIPLEARVRQSRVGLRGERALRFLLGGDVRRAAEPMSASACWKPSCTLYSRSSAPVVALYDAISV